MHLGTKASLIHRDPPQSHDLANQVDKWNSRLRSGCSSKGRPPTPTSFAVESELADHQRLTPSFDNRPVHQARFIGEDAEAGEFGSEGFGIHSLIFRRDAKKDQQTVTYPGHDSVIDCDRYTADSLNDCFHGFDLSNRFRYGRRHSRRRAFVTSRL